jgi:hypothetical protein
MNYQIKSSDINQISIFSKRKLAKQTKLTAEQSKNQVVQKIIC